MLTVAFGLVQGGGNRVNNTDGRPSPTSQIPNGFPNGLLFDAEVCMSWSVEHWNGKTACCPPAKLSSMHIKLLFKPVVPSHPKEHTGYDCLQYEGILPSQTLTATRIAAKLQFRSTSLRYLSSFSVMLPKSQEAETILLMF